MNKQHIVISTIFQNSGDATRALEIARIIRSFQPQGTRARITFISRGSRFEDMAQRLGFEVYHARPDLEGVDYRKDFQTKFGDLIGDERIATELLAGEIRALQELEPDLLIYGFWPVASIAARMAIPFVKTLAFLPVPLTESFLDMVTSFPDELALARLPRAVQTWLIRALPKRLRLLNPAIRHPTLKKAATKLGWQGEELQNIFSMLRSHTYLINDFEIFYDTSRLNSRFVFSGPIFARAPEGEIEDKCISEILDDKSAEARIFCTLGSSGTKQALLEIIDAVNLAQASAWRGIILSPKSVCPLNEAARRLTNKGFYVTDAFVPAAEINKKVDLVICHGGQGTLQTAIASGTPVLGLAAQPEQQINLQHLADFGMAIRLPVWKWESANIVQNVRRILANPDFRRRAGELKKLQGEIPTQKIIADTVWKQLAG